jgi:hypothetical protein
VPFNKIKIAQETFSPRTAAAAANFRAERREEGNETFSSAQQLSEIPSRANQKLGARERRSLNIMKD